MIYPAVMFIEMALDGIKKCSVEELAKQAKEFHSLGEGRTDDLEALPNLAGYSPLEIGYLVGLETARVLLATNIAAMKAGVTL